MNKHSLHFSILSFFIFTSLVAFILLGSFIIKSYRDDLKHNQHQMMIVLAEDIVHQGLHHQPADRIRKVFHQHNEHHHSELSSVFDDLSFSYADTFSPPPEGLSISKQLDDGRYLVITSSMASIKDRTYHLGTKLGFSFIMALVLFIIIFHSVLKRLLNPLHCLIDFCNGSSAERSVLPLCSGSYEVNNLKEAILNLMDKNQQLCKNKQDVFKEAAHEIKSPIAILKARLSLFQQSHDYDKQKFIQETFNDIDKISHKLKELIFLKEIEWDMQKDKETISVQEQCSMMRASFQPILDKKGVTMEADLAKDFTLTVYKEAIEKVMQAIFENIFMHTKNGSVIRNIIDPDEQRMTIINERSDKSDEKLFSSSIGSKMINRLAKKLGYTYTTREDEKYFYTTLVFENDTEKEKCEG